MFCCATFLNLIFQEHSVFLFSTFRSCGIFAGLFTTNGVLQHWYMGSCKADILGCCFFFFGGGGSSTGVTNIFHNDYECHDSAKASQRAINSLMGLIHHYFYHLHLRFVKMSPNGSRYLEVLHAEKWRSASYYVCLISRQMACKPASLQGEAARRGMQQ